DRYGAEGESQASPQDRDEALRNRSVTCHRCCPPSSSKMSLHTLVVRQCCCGFRPTRGKYVPYHLCHGAAPACFITSAKPSSPSTVFGSGLSPLLLLGGR